MEKVIKKYNWISVLIFIMTIVIAHFFVTNPYEWQNNTISELASQNYKHRWIMKSGFIFFGGILSTGIIAKTLINKKFKFAELLMFIYGIAILISGIYSTKPFIENIEYSVLEANIHSISATIAGFSFSIGIFIFAYQENNKKLKIIHSLFFVFVIGCSIAFGLLNNKIGVIQRIMYLGSFTWLLFFYNREYNKI